MRTLVCLLSVLIYSLSLCGGARDAYATFAHPELIKSHVTNIALLEEISKFRSGAGHVFSYDASFNHDGEYFGATDASEPESSMKHYLAPYSEYLGDAVTVPVYAPLDGSITRVTEEVDEDDSSIINKRIEITSADDSDYTLVIFHIDLNDDYPQILNDWPAAVWPAHQADDTSYVTDAVNAGDLIGYADMRTGHDFDVAVLHSISSIEKYWTSYFDLMPDSLFFTYSSRGASRGNLTITKAERSSDPITWWGSRNDDDWVELHAVPENTSVKIALLGFLLFLGRTPPTVSRYTS